MNCLINQPVRHAFIFRKHPPNPHVTGTHAAFLLAHQNPGGNSRLPPASVQPLSGHGLHIPLILPNVQRVKSLGCGFSIPIAFPLISLRRNSQRLDSSWSASEQLIARSGSDGNGRTDCQPIFSARKSIQCLINQPVCHAFIFRKHPPNPHVTGTHAAFLLAHQNPRGNSRFPPASVQPLSGHGLHIGLILANVQRVKYPTSSQVYLGSRPIRIAPDCCRGGNSTGRSANANKRWVHQSAELHFSISGISVWSPEFFVSRW
jgi:hypothetical protein